MGAQIALSGISVVFAGLVLIAIVIVCFNKISAILSKRKELALQGDGSAKDAIPKPRSAPAIQSPDIPRDDLVAITVAVELYRKIHFETLPSEITFVHGADAQNAWKMGNKFGQRRH